MKRQTRESIKVLDFKHSSGSHFATRFLLVVSHTFTPMTITKILATISQKRVACILEDRPDAIPLLDQLVHLAIDVDKAKEHPTLYELEEKKKEFYELLRQTL